jgi:uncharacterized delta-60 repeat protein
VRAATSVAAQSPDASAAPSMAPGGTLDGAYGDGGLAIVDLGASDDAIHGLVATPDGSAYLLGEARRDDRSLRTFAIARLTPAGALDPAWGRDGRVHTGFGENLSGGAHAGALDADGNLVVVGVSANPKAHHETFAVARYRPDGTLDPTFGTGGRVLTAVWPETGAGPADIARAVAIDPEGRVVVAGETGSFFHDIAVARYFADGSLDRSFGTTGIVTLDLGGDDRANALALAADGGILVAGSGWTEGPDEDMVVLRLADDGTLDVGFGAGGIAQVDVRGGADRAFGVVARADGTIVLGGVGQLSGGCVNPCERYGLALTRLTADGRLDPTFGEEGRIFPDLLTSSGGYALTELPTGGMALVGHIGNEDLGLLQLTPDGLPLPVFDGIAITIDVNGFADRGWGVAPGPDGSILLAGDTNDGSGAFDGVVVKYLPPAP